MDYLLEKHTLRLRAKVFLSPSKSESNRALLIQALAEKHVGLRDLSDAQDTQTMLHLLKNDPKIWDVIDSGTAMRFLTAYLAIKGEDKIITGSDRMKERPIGPLVDALRSIGSSIRYLEKEGFPPLRVQAIREQLSHRVSIPAHLSSQYISALLMIAPRLSNGLQIRLSSEVFSKPYILMTLHMMKAFGITSEWIDQTIRVKHGTYSKSNYSIEGDWSGASYWYSMLSLSSDRESSLILPNLRPCSWQGDRRIAEIMQNFGVKTQFLNGSAYLSKTETTARSSLKLDLRDCPDLAQTLMVVAAAKGIAVVFTGLESLKIKETDRVRAMQIELKKIDAQLKETNKEWLLLPSKCLPDRVDIHTYNDHRMAMAFAPLCQVMSVNIRQSNVVRKSYPSFWDEIKKAFISS